MSKKIVLVSDNHFDKSVLTKIVRDNPDADYYLHCGDSEMYAKDISPFVSVRGNNDYDRDYPTEKLIQIENKRILIIHGHRYVSYFSNFALIEKAQERQADVVFYGHTHVFADFVDTGIRFINPGSCAYPRDGEKPCYACVIINGNDVNVQRIFL